MSAQRDGVLAAMEAAEVRCGPILAEAMVKGRAAVSELLAADLEYDTAKVGMYLAEGTPGYEAAVARFQAAGERRGNAIAAARGQTAEQYKAELRAAIASAVQHGSGPNPAPGRP